MIGSDVIRTMLDSGADFYTYLANSGLEDMTG